MTITTSDHLSFSYYIVTLLYLFFITAHSSVLLGVTLFVFIIYYKVVFWVIISYINDHYNDTTGFTPNELQTGEMPKRVWDGCIRRIATQNLPIPNVVKRIEARRRIKKCAEDRTEKFNADHKLVTFKTGEL